MHVFTFISKCFHCSQEDFKYFQLVTVGKKKKIIIIFNNITSKKLFQKHINYN